MVFSVSEERDDYLRSTIKKQKAQIKVQSEVIEHLIKVIDQEVFRAKASYQKKRLQSALTFAKQKLGDDN